MLKICADSRFADMESSSLCQAKIQVDIHAHLILRSACASAQSVQSSMAALWLAKGPTLLQAENYDSDQNERMRRLISISLYAHANSCLLRLPT